MTRNLFGVDVPREDYHALLNIATYLLSGRGLHAPYRYDPDEAEYAARVAVQAWENCRDKFARLDRAKLVEVER